MSGDQERDASRQHPTEREAFEEWNDEFGYCDNVMEDAAWEAWQAGRVPLLKEIEFLTEVVDTSHKDTLYFEAQCKEKDAVISKMREMLSECHQGISEIYLATSNPDFFTGGQDGASRHRLNWIFKSAELVSAQSKQLKDEK